MIPNYLKIIHCKCGKKIDYRAKRCYSCAHKSENNPNFKTGETLKKHYCIESNCKNEIGYSNFLYGSKQCSFCATKGKNNSMSGKQHTQETKEKMSLVAGGTGIPYEYANYNKTIFNNKLKEFVRNRDNYTCQNCIMTEEENIIVYGRILDIHHIDYDKKNCKETNLISLCQGCNLRANYNRHYWKEIYKNKILLNETIIKIGE